MKQIGLILICKACASEDNGPGPSAGTNQGFEADLSSDCQKDEIMANLLKICSLGLALQHIVHVFKVCAQQCVCFCVNVSLLLPSSCPYFKGRQVIEVTMVLPPICHSKQPLGSAATRDWTHKRTLFSFYRKYIQANCIRGRAEVTFRVSHV